MKKITLLIASFLVASVGFAQITLTQSVDDSVVEDGVACGVASSATAQNNWWRSYNLADFPAVTGSFEITSVEFGVGQVDFGDANLFINIYSTDAAFPGGNLTLLTDAAPTVTSADVGSIVVAVFDTPVTVSNTDEIVVELVGLDDDIVAFRIGQNELGETGVSYLSALDCSINEPTPIADIGFPDNIILNLIGDNVLAIGDNLAEVSSVYPNPTINVLNVKLPSNVDVLEANLYDILGQNTGLRLVNGTMNTANLARGVYILNVETSAGTLTQKVIKN